jgi:hydroxypyruvate isomerase
LKFSANLGFLWAEFSLPDAIIAAGQAGFDAVECHWPYDIPHKDTRAALAQSDLEMLLLNTSRGNSAAGEMGLLAVPGREKAARAAIDEAIDYATQIGAKMVHCMAGNAHGPAAEAVYLENLLYASEQAGDVKLLIEPLNAADAPAYFLRDTRQAVAILETMNRDNLRLMFDCYHVGRTEGDVIGRFHALKHWIGHIQIAAVPDRGSPDHGEVDYTMVFGALRDAGWHAPIGAEYRPNGATEQSLGWLRAATMPS